MINRSWRPSTSTSFEPGSVPDRHVDDDGLPDQGSVLRMIESMVHK